MMDDKFPVGAAAAQRLIQPLVLLAVRLNFLVGIDHEKVGVAVSELVIKLRIGQRHVLIIVRRVDFVVAEHGIKRHAAD